MDGDRVCRLPNMPTVPEFVLAGRSSVRVDAGTFRDPTICRSEEVYADRGMLEVDPVTNVPRANLAPLQQFVQLGRQPSNTKNTANWKCDHAFIRVRVRHH